MFVTIKNVVKISKNNNSMIKIGGKKMKNILNEELLEKLQNACDIMTEGYETQTGNSRIRFGVLQTLVRSCPKCSH